MTFALTVFADLTIAVQAGMIIAALLFIRKVATTTTISQVVGLEIESDRVHLLQDKEIPPHATVFRIHGPFLFGAAEKIDQITERIADLPPIVILRVRHMTAIDSTAAGNRGPGAQPPRRRSHLDRLRRARAAETDDEQARFHEHLGAENRCANVQAAIERARAIQSARATA